MKELNSAALKASSSVKKRGTTKTERKAKLMSTFRPLCDLACDTVRATDTVVNALGQLFSDLHIQGKSKSKLKLAEGTEIVANPNTEKNQRQRRLQPSSYGAPTTKANKTASRNARKEKAATERMMTRQASGRDSTGQRSWG